MYSGTRTRLEQNTSCPPLAKNCTFTSLRLSSHLTQFLRLIWNLMASGNSNIEHILSAHYRAITDINWHTKEPNIVSSTGIDSWVWTWDLREPRKAIFGLCAFAAPGTQVKWNRQDPNILASAHANEVLLWDRRKGSLPISKIDAHTSKIYGIDWSHHDSREIVTCSLDKTIKVWDMHEADPKSVINTTYPVWRARNLPFGRGILSLAQRGETMLEMYATEGSREPIHEFEGHTDVVKEFVWRRGGQGSLSFVVSRTCTNFNSQTAMTSSSSLGRKTVLFDSGVSILILSR